MTHEEIIAGNLLIANFMEYPGDGKGMYFKPHMDSEDLVGPEDLPYHFSWDWLMPVVEKIASINTPNHAVTMRGWARHLQIGIAKSPAKVSWPNQNWIETTYATVVEFIKWYNQNHKHNESNNT